jgi:hypothetical protein
MILLCALHGVEFPQQTTWCTFAQRFDFGGLYAKLGSSVHLTDLLNQVPVYVWLGLYNCRIQLRYREQLYGMSALDGIYSSNGIQGLLRQPYALSFSGLSLWYAVCCMRKIPPGIAYSQRRRSMISRQVSHYLFGQ